MIITYADAHYGTGSCIVYYHIIFDLPPCLLQDSFHIKSRVYIRIFFTVHVLSSIQKVSIYSTYCHVIAFHKEQVESVEDIVTKSSLLYIKITNKKLISLEEKHPVFLTEQVDCNEWFSMHNLFNLISIITSFIL